MTRSDRRALLVAAALVPLAVAAVRIGSEVAAGLDALARTLRPRASGSSAGRCAACGATDHTMLDAACPLAPAVRNGARA